MGRSSLTEIVADPYARWELLMQRWKQAEGNYEIAAQRCLNIAASSSEFEYAKQVEDAALQALLVIKKSIDDLINSSFENRVALDGSLVVATIQLKNYISTSSAEMPHVQKPLAPKQKNI